MALFTELYIQAKEVARRLGQDEGGATAIEYALIAALISVVVIGTVTTLGTEIDSVFQEVVDALTGAGDD